MQSSRRRAMLRCAIASCAEGGPGCSRGGRWRQLPAASKQEGCLLCKVVSKVGGVLCTSWAWWVGCRVRGACRKVAVDGCAGGQEVSASLRCLGRCRVLLALCCLPCGRHCRRHAAQRVRQRVRQPCQQRHRAVRQCGWPHLGGQQDGVCAPGCSTRADVWQPSRLHRLLLLHGGRAAGGGRLLLQDAGYLLLQAERGAAMPLYLLPAVTADSARLHCAAAWHCWQSARAGCRAGLQVAGGLGWLHALAQRDLTDLKGQPCVLLEVGHLQQGGAGRG